MDISQSIRRPIKKEMTQYEALFQSILQHSDNLLGKVLRHIGHRHGKMMRPMLVLLCAREAGRVTDAALHAAVSLEMLHTASLVHDDIVDESDERRGQKSVNALYDNKVAVLSGDYLLSVALEQAAATEHLGVIKLIAGLGKSLSEGEILQLSNISCDDFSEDIYFSIIRRKTATLFTSCAQMGMMTGGAAPERVEEARKLGEIIGICFQIRDDIFDYSRDADSIGKPTGNDMAEGKLTLPMLYALNSTGNAEMKTLALKVKAGTVMPDEISRLVDFTKANGGITYAEQKMEEYRQNGLQILSHFTDENVRTALTSYLDFVITRTL